MARPATLPRATGMRRPAGPRTSVLVSGRLQATFVQVINLRVVDAPQKRAALLTTVSSTGLEIRRRGGDHPQHLGRGGLLLQRLASARWLRCSSSWNRRAFSMAMTAWSANVSSSAISRSVNGCTSIRATRQGADRPRRREAAERQRCPMADLLPPSLPVGIVLQRSLAGRARGWSAARARPDQPTRSRRQGQPSPTRPLERLPSVRADASRAAHRHRRAGRDRRRRHRTGAAALSTIASSTLLGDWSARWR